jgi:hypothetical protein
VVDRDDLLAAVRVQTYRLLLQLLRWSEGEYNLFVGDEISYDEGMEPLSVGELLIRANEDLGARGPLEAPLPDLAATFERRSDSRSQKILGRDAEEPRDDPGEVWLSLEEALVLDRLEVPREGPALLAETSLDEYQLRFALHRLERLGLIPQGRAFDRDEIASTGLRQRVRPQQEGESAPEPKREEAATPAPDSLSDAVLAPGAGEPLPEEEAADIFDTGGFTRFSPDEVLSGSGKVASTPSPPASPFEEVAPAEEEEPEVEAEPPPPRREKTRFDPGAALEAWFGRVLAFGLLLVLALTVSLSSERTTLFFPYPWQDDLRREFEGYQRESLLVKVDRAIRTYYLLYGRFPEQLGILVDLELLGPSDTSDPRGRVLEYSTAGMTYTLQPSEAGVTVPGLDRTEEVSEDFLLNPEYVAVTRQDRRPLVLLD